MIETGLHLIKTQFRYTVKKAVIMFTHEKEILDKISSCFAHRTVASSLAPRRLYVWDHTEHIPLFVKNNAAELLFGNIAAESVYACYHGQGNQNLASGDNSSIVSHSEAAWELQAATTQSCFQHLKRSWPRKATGDAVIPNLHGIWFILLKTLLQQGKNSPLRFGVAVNNELDEENGRFELINLTMPCYEGHAAVSPLRHVNPLLRPERRCFRHSTSLAYRKKPPTPQLVGWVEDGNRLPGFAVLAQLRPGLMFEITDLSPPLSPESRG
ncbi:hypothetical protein ACLOJK_016558 [Asimina triloba]